MKEKLKKQKGITLIALIITIIIMLILAIVSVNIIVNQGIIRKSEDAVDKYKEKEGEEQAKLTEWERLMEQYGGASEEAYITPRTEITYKGQTLKVGDYVNYDEGTGYTWDRDEEKTGTSGDYGCHSFVHFQTENMKWRVLGLDKDGNLELISDKETSNELILSGKEGYNNGVEQLNEMCDSLYGKGTNAKSARSVNAEDINAILGYNKKGFEFEGIGCISKNVHWRYGWKTTYYSTKTTWEPKDTFIMEDGSNEYIRQGNNTDFISIEGTKATDEKPITIESNLYFYTRDEFIERVNLDVLNMIFGTSEGSKNTCFWLASRYVNADCDSADWGLLYISESQLQNIGFYGYNIWNNRNLGDHVRPVVTLKSDVQLRKTSESEWTIQ